MKAKTAKNPKLVIHIEERLSLDNRGLCYAKMDFYDNTYKTNMTTKMSESTCPKCIEIRKKRVAQAVETRAFRKAYRQRLIDEAKAEVDDAKAIAEAMKTEEVDFAVFAVRYSGTGSDGISVLLPPERGLKRTLRGRFKRRAQHCCEQSELAK